MEIASSSWVLNFSSIHDFISDSDLESLHVCDPERDGQPLLPLHAQDVHRPPPPGEVRPRQPRRQEGHYQGHLVGHTQGGGRLGEYLDTLYSLELVLNLRSYI